MIFPGDAKVESLRTEPIRPAGASACWFVDPVRRHRSQRAMVLTSLTFASYGKSSTYLSRLPLATDDGGARRVTYPDWSRCYCESVPLHLGWYSMWPDRRSMPGRGARVSERPEERLRREVIHSANAIVANMSNPRYERRMPR